MKTIVKTEELDSIVGTISDEYYGRDSAYAARPYLDAILSMQIGESMYYNESLHDLLMYLISNLRGYRGGAAPESKKALQRILAAA